MRVYNVNTKIRAVQRSKGENAVAGAAYNAREKLALQIYDKKLGITATKIYDYRDKPGLVFSKIYVPVEDPANWMLDREKLWNKAEQADNRCDANPAQRFFFNLPLEFTDEQNREVMEMAAKELTAKGMIVDIAQHDDSENNPHFHIQVTTREIVKNRYGEYDLSPVKNLEWRGYKFCKEIRELNAKCVNIIAKRDNVAVIFKAESLKEQGIERESAVHLGPAHKMKSGNLMLINLEIAERNADRLLAKPELLISDLAIDKPVFSKEQIEQEIEKWLYSGIDFKKLENAEELKAELAKSQTEIYQKVLKSDAIEMVTDEDLKGRTLYASTRRLKLEERFYDNVTQLSNSKNHQINISKEDIDNLSSLEEIKEKIRDGSEKATAKLAEKIAEKTGLKLDIIKENIPKAKANLNEEQVAAVINILKGEDISVLEGIPGAGKTTTMQEIVRQYKKSGYKIIGATPSSAAALQLAKATNIECKNVDLWRKEWQAESGFKYNLSLPGNYYEREEYQNSGSNLNNKTILIIDEAGMMELTKMDYLISKVRSAGGKVILSGDGNQLSPVGWSGGFEIAKSVSSYERLERSQRQKNPTHQKITKLLSNYQIRSAIDLMIKEDMIIFTESEAEANSEAIKRFTDKYIEISSKQNRDDLVTSRSMAIGVSENKTRRLINDAVRVRLKEAGIIKGSEYEYFVGYSEEKDESTNTAKLKPQKLKLARGDQIVFSKNANHLGSKGIYNGELATVLRTYQPNEQGLGQIKLLVHKASGKKETVTIDLEKLAEYEWFKQGTHLEHGYAVTAHKIQGDTVDIFMPKLEKTSGYELTNVLLTRHREECKIIVSNEILRNSYYESLDKTASEAKNRFIAVADNIEVIQKGGLAKLISKRANNLSAFSYFNQSTKQNILTPEDKALNNYQDSCENTIFTVRKLVKWQDKIYKQTGSRPAMYEHKKLWQEFLKHRQKRATDAGSLLHSYAPNGKLAYDARNDYQHLTFDEYMEECKIATYGRFKNRFIQLNINYATIEKHNSQYTGFKAIDQLVVHAINSKFSFTKPYKELLDAIENENHNLISKTYYKTMLEIQDNEIIIAEKSEQYQELQNAERELKDAIEGERDYRKITTPEYLSRIYKEDGEEILNKYQELKSSTSKYGINSAELIEKIDKNPTILGKLQGVGIGSLFGISNSRKDAIALIDNLAKQLRAYEASEEIMKKYELKLVNENYTDKMMALQNQIKQLREELPGELDREFLEIVGDSLNKNGNLTSNNTDNWQQLKELEIYESVNMDAKISMLESKAEDAVTEEKLLKQRVNNNKVNNNRANNNSNVKSAENITENINKFNQAELDYLENISNNQKILNIANKSQISAKQELESENSTISPIMAKIIKEKENTDTRKAKISNLDRLDKTAIANQDRKLDKQHYQQSKQYKAAPHKYEAKEVEQKAIANSVSIFSHYAERMVNHRVGKDSKLDIAGDEMKCGSIYMNKKSGMWHRKSTGEGGNILSFLQAAKNIDTNNKGEYPKFLENIAKELGVSETREYQEWYKEYGHLIDKTANQQSTNKQSTEKQVTNKQAANHDITSKIQTKPVEWKLAGMPAKEPEFTERNLKWLTDKNYQTESIHHYRDIDGKLLGIVARMVDEHGKKLPMPFSWCRKYENGKATKSYNFIAKGFSDRGYKPIYGVEKINNELESQHKAILIVEGEKTTDKAAEMFKDHIVISWMGGTSSSDKVDWSPLKERNVIISPDNDLPGIKAAARIKGELDRINGCSGFVNIVDLDEYQLDKLTSNLPTKLAIKPEEKDPKEGWDLADKGVLNIEQYEEIFNKTSKKGSNIGLEIKKEEQQLSKEISNIAATYNYGLQKNAIEEENHSSKSIYLKSLTAIANNPDNNINMADDKNFIANMNKSKNIYQKQKFDFIESKQYQDLNNRCKGSSGELKRDLILDTALYHQICLGTKLLNDTHMREIENAAEKIIRKTVRYSAEDKKAAGSEMHNIISSSDFLDNLDEANNKISKPLMDKQITEYENNSRIEKYFKLSEQKFANANNMEKALDAAEYNQKSLAKFYSEDITVPGKTAEDLENAYNYVKDNKIEKLKSAINFVIDNNITPESHLLQVLDFSGPLEKVDYYIEAEKIKHKVSNIIEDYRLQMKQAKTPQEILEIKQEQAKYLENLSKTCNYERVIIEFKYMIDLYKHELAENHYEKMANLATKAEAANLYDNDELKSIIRSSIKMEKAIDKIASPLEKHQINSSLAGFREEKENANNIKDTIAIITKEEKYLAKLHNNLNYPEYHDDHLKDKINQAVKSDEHKDELKYFVEHFKPTNNNFKNHIVKELRQVSTSLDAKDMLIKIHKEQVHYYVNYALDKISNNKTFSFHSKSYDCPNKFLTDYIHAMEVGNLRKYNPVSEIKEIHHELQQQHSQQRQMQQSKDYGISM